MREKIFILIFVLALILVSIFFVIINKKSTINIYVVPNNATVYVDNKEVGKGHITTRVTNGEHQIKATRDGYNTYSEDIPVSGDTSQTIILVSSQATQRPVGTVNITPYAANSFQSTSSDTLIAIDSNNSSLIKIEKNQITTLYSKPVYAFSFVKPYVVLVEKGNRDKIAVINIESGSTKNFDAKDFSPIVSVSVGDDAKNFYFLGGYDTVTRNATLYTSSLDIFSPKSEGVCAADDIKALANNEVFLTLNADATDLSTFSIYDVSNKKYLYHTNGSGALISPSYKNVVIYSSTSLKIVSLNNLTEKFYNFSFINQKVVWFNPDILIVLMNGFPGVKFYKINASSNTQTSDYELTKLNQISVRFAIGVVENTLFLQDSVGKVWSAVLP
jgi:hypothetical protein